MLYIYRDVLQDLVTSYNNTNHSSIKRPPSSITSENELEVYKDIYMPYVNKTSSNPLQPSLKQVTS